MSPRRRTLTQRIKDHLGFSLVAILILFIVLRMFGVRSTVASFFFSVLLTIGLNVGLSYYYDHKGAEGGARPDPRGGDIRWVEEDDRPRGRGRDRGRYDDWDGYAPRDRYDDRGRGGYAGSDIDDVRDRGLSRDRFEDRYRHRDDRYDRRDHYEPRDRYDERRFDPREDRDPRMAREDREDRRG